MKGDKLKNWRQKWHLTQGALAGLLGVHRVTIAKWEAETRGIPPFLNLALAGLESRIGKGGGSDGVIGELSEMAGCEKED
jgi:DNA-binding XRE family transcriptional regulator